MNNISPISPNTSLGNVEPPYPTFAPTVTDQIKQLLSVAADLRKSINSAKTAPKKQYYLKKFAKVQKQAVQLVMAIDKSNELLVPAEEPVHAIAPI